VEVQTASPPLLPLLRHRPRVRPDAQVGEQSAQALAPLVVGDLGLLLVVGDLLEALVPRIGGEGRWVGPERWAGLPRRSILAGFPLAVQPHELRCLSEVALVRLLGLGLCAGVDAKVIRVGPDRQVLRWP
jgi:hypothetical protein